MENSIITMASPTARMRFVRNETGFKSWSAQGNYQIAPVVASNPKESVISSGAFDL